MWNMNGSTSDDKACASRPLKLTPTVVKSKLGNTCANVYTQGKFTHVIPMTSWNDAGKSLVNFTDGLGIPEKLITDGAMEFTG
jgi:hypothetical protein